MTTMGTMFALKLHETPVTWLQPSHCFLSYIPGSSKMILIDWAFEHKVPIRNLWCKCTRIFLHKCQLDIRAQFNTSTCMSKYEVDRCYEWHRMYFSNPSAHAVKAFHPPQDKEIKQWHCLRYEHCCLQRHNIYLLLLSCVFMIKELSCHKLYRSWQIHLISLCIQQITCYRNSTENLLLK